MFGSLREGGHALRGASAIGVDGSVFVMDHVVASRELQIERKHFTVEYRENDRGRFLRIVEEAHGRRNTIIIPGTGIGDFTGAVTQVLMEAQSLTPA